MEPRARKAVLGMTAQQEQPVRPEPQEPQERQEPQEPRERQELREPMELWEPPEPRELQEQLELMVPQVPLARQGQPVQGRSFRLLPESPSL